MAACCHGCISGFSCLFEQTRVARFSCNFPPGCCRFPATPPPLPLHSCSSHINLECLFNFVCSIAAFFVLICRKKIARIVVRWKTRRKNPKRNLANCVAIIAHYGSLLSFVVVVVVLVVVVAVVAAGVVQLAGSCVVSSCCPCSFFFSVRFYCHWSCSKISIDIVFYLWLDVAARFSFRFARFRRPGELLWNVRGGILVLTSLAKRFFKCHKTRR